MQKKIKKLKGISHEAFNEFVESGEILLRPARLIPLLKIGDEMALTSIFLSALKYVNEFRDSIFGDIKLSRSSRILYFTEVSFPSIAKECRFDGMVLVVSAGNIKDVAIFEMKNKQHEITASQVEGYMKVLKALGIDKMVTVSNQFSPNHTILPYELKRSSGIANYHFSWTYILTVGHLLLFQNESKIEDSDQSYIMKEVLNYFEHKESGITDFNKMKAGWKDVSERILSKSALNKNDKIVTEAVESWVQEEKDMCLMLSRELGVMVKVGRDSKSYKMDSDINDLIKNQKLLSALKVLGSVSEIQIIADFVSRTVSMSVSVDAPLDKGLKGRLGWIIRQVEKCQSKYPEDFACIENELFIESAIKYSRNNERHSFKDFERFYDLDKASDITKFNIIVIRDFGRSFESVRKFVELIEQMLLEYYVAIVQNLTNWERPAPKLGTQID